MCKYLSLALPPSLSSFKFFVLDVYNSDGTPLTVDQLYMQLEKIWNSSLQTNKEPIGILTSNHRNTWGKAYNNLIKGDLELSCSANLARFTVYMCSM